MAYRCANCGKGSDHGHNVSHAKNRTIRVRKPNLHRATLRQNGASVKALLCTKCLRMVKSLVKAEKKTDEAPVVSA